nr:membrane-spanning 4-domains subfamily A member 15-like isoform X2 [Pogona vitticeps]
MTTDPMRIQNGMLLFIPPNGASFLQGVHGGPGSVIPPTGMVQYLQYGGQEGGSSQPQQNRLVGRLDTFLKAEAKTLGAIQIIIGLIHIGFGGVAIIFSTPFQVAAHGFFSFWGGVLFIASGSLSVAAEKYLDKFLSVATGLSVLLLLFTILEFFITGLAARVTCQAACCSNDTAAAFVPYSVIGSGVTSTENYPAPPPYDHVVLTSSTDA